MDKHSIPQPNDVIFFDVDGVLTNLTQNKADEDLLQLLSNLIKNKFIVVLNSGRSMAWLRHVILEPLNNFNSQTQNLNLTNFFVIGEKGGVWLDFDQTTFVNSQTLTDESIKIPNKLILMVKKLIESEFNKVVFRDLTKQIILTLEKRPTASTKDFQNAQKKIVLKLRNILSENELKSVIEIDSTTIAIDIQNVILGKGYGVKKVIDYLNQHQIATNQFFTIGDSISDFEMSETLFQMAKPVLHVHVGETPVLLKTNYPVLTTSQKYAFGTKEYFKDLIEKYKF